VRVDPGEGSRPALTKAEDCVRPIRWASEASPYSTWQSVWEQRHLRYLRAIESLKSSIPAQPS